MNPEAKQVNQDIVINKLFAKVNQITNELILKDAYIEQLEGEIAKMKEETV
jgi:hypothetical protein